MNLDMNELNKLKDTIKSSIDDGSIQDVVKKVAEDGVKKGVEGINGGISSLNNYLNTSGEKKEQMRKCPNCNGPLDSIAYKDVVKCPYCDTDIDFSANKTITDRVFTIINQQQEMEAERRAEERRRQEIEDAKPFYKKKIFGAILLALLMPIIGIAMMEVPGYMSHKRSMENEAKLELLLQDINQDIANGDLDSAEIKANMLKEDSGYSMEVEQKWDDTRESVLKIIDEKKKATP